MEDIEKNKFDQTATNNYNNTEHIDDWLIDSEIDDVISFGQSGKSEMSTWELAELKKHLANSGFMQDDKYEEDNGEKLRKDYQDLVDGMEEWDEKKTDDFRNVVGSYIQFALQESQKSVEGEKDDTFKRVRDKVLNSLYNVTPKEVAETIFRTTAPLAFILSAPACQTVKEVEQPKEHIPISSSTSIPNDGEIEDTTIPNQEVPTKTIEPTPTLEPTPTMTVEPTATLEPTPTPIPEIDPQEFDYSMLDLMQWEGELKASNIEKHEPGYIVEVKEGYRTVLYELPLFPLDEDRVKDSYWNYVTILDIPEGTKFELLETRKITGENGESITVGTLRNHSGVAMNVAVGVVVLSAETEEGETINFTKSSESEEIAVGNLFAEGSTTEQLVLSLFFRNLLEYQKENGPFKAGEEYSIVEVAKIISTEEFKRLLNWPEGHNGTLDKLTATLSHFLMNEHKIATRRPSKLAEEIGAYGGPIGLNVKLSDSYTCGVRINGGNAPENDVVLTFQEGENGETEYYIIGDMTGIKDGYTGRVGYVTYYIKSELEEGELEASLKRIEEVYQKHLDWEKGEEEPLSEDATSCVFYSPKSPEGFEKLKQVLNAIYTPASKADFYK